VPQAGGIAEEGGKVASDIAVVKASRPFSEQSLRILLAEDSHVNQRLAIGLLTKRGHHVSVANDGREAIHLYESRRFDLVLMDVQMPEMDGFQATRAIRQHDRGCGRYTPIIALTAHAMKGDRERCLEAGMDAYVSKPVRAGDLYATIEKVWANCRETGEPRHLISGMGGESETS
jgi:CheY-like chemotaxis protein